MSGIVATTLRILFLTSLSLLWDTVAAQQQQDVCVTSSAPNPIAQDYPDVPTGTLNATLAIVPIPLATARQLVPAQYAILEGAYRALMPSFPEGMYPVLMQAALDHDIQVASMNINVPDFQRFGWSFPFIDLLGDGFSSFTWAPAQMISADNALAINGSRDYGTIVGAATFSPSCEAYTLAAAADNNNNNNDSFFSFSGNATAENMFVSLRFRRSNDADTTTATTPPPPLEFYQNITNQPIFADGAKCDRQVRLFNSTLNQGVNAPVVVRGDVRSNVPPLDTTMTTTTTAGGVLGADVFGLLIDTPFVEFNGLDCQTLKGYSGTGPGD